MVVVLHQYTCCVSLRTELQQGTLHGSDLDPYDQHLEAGKYCTEGEGGFHQS